jgi:hypothetical protein
MTVSPLLFATPPLVRFEARCPGYPLGSLLFRLLKHITQPFKQPMCLCTGECELNGGRTLRRVRSNRLRSDGNVVRRLVLDVERARPRR